MSDKSHREWAEDYLADMLSPVEAEDYARLLLENDDAVRELQAAAGRELALRSALQATALPKTRRQVRRVEPSRPGNYRWMFVAAAAALLAAFLYMLLSPSPEPVDSRSAKTPTPKRVPEPSPAPEKPVAPPVAVPKQPSPEEKPAPKVEREPLETPIPPKPEPLPPPPPPPDVPKTPETPKRPEPPAVKPAPPTEAVIARIDALSGEARLLSGGTPAPASAKGDIRAGQGLETRSRATVSFSFLDGSSFDLEPGTLVSQIQAEGGKKILLEKGTLRGKVSKQPKDQPLVIATPHGEAKVLGTVLRLHVDSDPRKGTRLDVTEGKVELKNSAGRKVTVDAGSTATAAAGAPLVPGFLELDGWLRNVRNAAGATGYGELEIADDPLEAGKKCFRLSYPTTLQGLVLTLPERIPLQEFGGLTCEVLIPVGSPRALVFDSEVADPREKFSTAEQVTITKRGSWQPLTFKPSDYKGLAQLDGFITRIYVCELLPGVAANAAPTHDVYFRHVQIRRLTPPK